MSNTTFTVLALIGILGLGVISYKEDQRCSKGPTPSCHYTLRMMDNKPGPL